MKTLNYRIYIRISRNLLLLMPFVACLAMADRSTEISVLGKRSGDAPNSCVGPGIIDAPKLEDLIHRRLAGNVVGYAFAFSEGGVPIGAGQGGFAQIPYLDSLLPFTVFTDIHVASVSKPITAIALLKLMEVNGVLPDDPIFPYLPSHWQKGEGFDEDGITFDDLMTHQTGVDQKIAELSNELGEALPNPNTWEGLRLLVSKGIPKSLSETACPTDVDKDGIFEMGAPQAAEVDHYGVYCYKNANIALSRELIWRLGLNAGVVDPEFDAIEKDKMPKASAGAYQKYVQDYVLAPAGASGACYPSENPAARSLMYDIDGNVPGQLLTEGTDAYGSEDSSLLQCGPFGWSLSAADLLLILSEFTCGELLSEQSKQYMKNLKLGWSQASNSGDYIDRYWHSGLWRKTRSSAEKALWPLHPDHPANDPTASEEDCSFVGAELVCPAKGKASNLIHTCIVEFPFDVDATLVMNSGIRNEDGVNACNVLHDAFDQL